MSPLGLISHLLNLRVAGHRSEDTELWAEHWHVTKDISLGWGRLGDIVSYKLLAIFICVIAASPPGLAHFISYLLEAPLRPVSHVCCTLQSGYSVTRGREVSLTRFIGSGHQVLCACVFNWSHTAVLPTITETTTWKESLHLWKFTCHFPFSFTISVHNSTFCTAITLWCKQFNVFLLTFIIYYISMLPFRYLVFMVFVLIST